MSNVAHVIQRKQQQAIYTISPDATVLEAITLMADKGIGALVVTTGNDVVGILSERDYTRKVALMERSSYNTLVSDIMTAKVLTVGMQHKVDECLNIMTSKHLRHLPVVEDGQLKGMISIGDLVKAAMEDQKILIEQLQQYISG